MHRHCLHFSSISQLNLPSSVVRCSLYETHIDIWTIQNRKRAEFDHKYINTANMKHSLFVQIFNMHIISIGLNLYVDVCRGVFRAQPNVYGGASLEKSQESFTVDFRLGSKYASGIGFTVEKIYRMSVFI